MDFVVNEIVKAVTKYIAKKAAKEAIKAAKKFMELSYEDRKRIIKVILTGPDFENLWSKYKWHIPMYFIPIIGDVVLIIDMANDVERIANEALKQMKT